MLGIDSNVALDCKKKGLMAKTVSNASSSVNTTSAAISLFGFDIRQKIQNDAERCNITSSQLFASRPKEEQDSVLNLCSGANKHINNLQDTLSWTQKAGQELMTLPALDDRAKSTLSNTMKETLNFGTETISNAISNINEAMTKLSGTASDAPESVKSTVSKTQNSIDDKTQELATDKHTKTDDFIDDKIDAKTITEKPEVKTDTEKPDINKNIDFGKTFKTNDKTTTDLNTDLKQIPVVNKR